VYKIQSVTWDKIIETFPENLNQYILNRTERLNQPDMELSEYQRITGEIYLLEEKLKRTGIHCRERRELRKQIATLKRELKKLRRTR
jgi:hypothetical protein